ncbi:MAG: FAD-dependent oxidoreductase [Candidatus Marinimicrobia bacterium]|nr:FAD-dependent oxidoreductase [Candidatus Neomarinimicrobiota bacterium]
MDNIEKNKKSGSVLVIGAGIAGIQSSLDLADSGYKVHLLEKTPAIGGVMAQLDKTFPTNDCAMCVISPKLVECGRHLNINLMTDAKLKEVTGGPGNFKVKIYKHPRFVDLDKCTGCGECEKVCPVHVDSEFDEGLVSRTAIYKPYAQASPNAFVIEKKETAPCQISCPSGIHVQGYIALTAEGNYKEAYELIRKNNPFVSICGRVCFHPCETECRRGEYDEPLAIASIKRYIADYVHSHHEELDLKEAIVPKDKEKVAIIGSGPAGLSCGFYLARKGYQVTIFEKNSKTGGMMRSCIPPYRLSRYELDWEIEQILKEGIELKTNHAINSNEDIEVLRKEGFKAFYIAIGAQKSISLKILGEDLNGVYGGIDFLHKVNYKEKIKVGKKVAVIGGGNTAIDCARTARRMGAEVSLIYRRTRREMPAEYHEILAAKEEGIKFIFLTNPVENIGENGKLKSIKFDVMKLGEADESGRRRPLPTGEQFTEEFDNMLIAVSQSPDLAVLDGSGVDTTKWNTIKADPVTFETNVKDIFAGGDVVLGPASIVEAVGQANEAVVSIDRYLRSENIAEGRTEKPEYRPTKKQTEFVPEELRVPMPMVSAKKRVTNFDECEKGYSEEEVQKEAARCLECGICSGCLECESVCEADAILHSMHGEVEEINVGAIIVATGADKFDPTAMHQYGYGRYKNVLTSIQFERILAASGPFEGHLQRPDDGKLPKKIAWIQCVGSRTEDQHMPYCSSVCCMYAMKEAIIAKEHEPTIEPTIFYMDMRAFGKDFDKYYDKAEQSQVRFVRSRVGKIREISETGNLELYYTKENGNVEIEEFDLVVLSIGLRPPEDLKEMSDVLDIRLNSYGFIDHLDAMPIETTRPGVFVCGPAVSPKDIPETVMQASGSVAGAAEVLAKVRGTEITIKEFPPEKNVFGEKPRIGVFVCHCGINIGSIVDVPGVVEYIKKLPNVVYASDNLFTCSQDTQVKIKEIIKEYNLNRVVVSSCSPSTHEPLFQETIREAGLNPYLFEMANIRNHCSWVHRDDHAKATIKAKTLTRIAVGKVGLLEPLKTIALDVTQKGVIIGGGLAGMTAALSIAEQGFEVTLVEQKDKLGGNLQRLRETCAGENIQDYLKKMINKIDKHPLITVCRNSKVTSIEGYIGNYKTTIRNTESRESKEHKYGIIIITTGANETKPSSYLYGESENVMTQLELDEALNSNNEQFQKTKNVVMIQCVGSRNDEHPYCSRVCCTQSIKNAITLKKTNPKMNIFVLYRDIRTYGFNEKYYQEARQLGVLFMRYEVDRKPEVEIIEQGKKQKISVNIRDHVMGADVEIIADKLILASAMEPQKDANVISQMLKVPLNEDRFFVEAHVKLRPVDFSAEGIFLAGLAHSPKMMAETISQAKGAAERACTIISSDEYFSEANVSVADPNVCVGCGMCVPVCPYDAPGLVSKNGKEICEVNTALCKGCGSCASICPSGAMQQLGFKEEQTLEMVNQALATLL